MRGLRGKKSRVKKLYIKRLFWLLPAAFLFTGCGMKEAKIVWEGLTAPLPEKEAASEDYGIAESAGDIAPAKDKEFQFSGNMNIDYEYYYSLLPREEKEVYRQICDGLKAYREIELKTLDKNVVDRAFRYVCYDHPEIFYVSGYQLNTVMLMDKPVSMNLKGQFTMQKDQIESYSKEILSNTHKILSGMPTEGDDYARIRYIHDYLVEHTEYQAGAVNNQNICSVLASNRSVCNGYAQATQFLLNKAGIKCIYVSGTASGQNAHAWNIVYADGYWYYLDTTYADEGISVTEEDGTRRQVAMTNYDYFLITTEELMQTHKPADIGVLPMCQAAYDNYYVREGLYFSSAEDDAGLKAAFSNAYQKGEHWVSFRCVDKGVYDEMKRKLIDESGVFKYLTGSSVSYHFNDAFYVLHFQI